MAHWSLADIPWQDFDATRVDPDLLRVVKAAALVEYNGGDYADYLIAVFAGDAVFPDLARQWAAEEIQHGIALARWAELADPDFDFAAARRRFAELFRLPQNAAASVRGTRAGELVARCIVETGTSTYYTALMEAAEEPVLKEICRRIAADELRHYKLFYTHLGRYLAADRLGRWGRLRIALGRILESEDDELASAYCAANHADLPYERQRFKLAYARRAYPLYRRHHVERGIALALKAVGAPPAGRLNRFLTGLAYRLMRWRAQRLAALGA